jgi:hypothetical protein
LANWKFIAGSAGFAFFISFLTGLFSGVQFGTLLLRAVIGGVAFGGIAFGIEYIIKRYLPELTKAISPEQQPREASPNVDIVIEDETPPGSAGYAPADEKASDRAQSASGPTGENSSKTTGESDISADNTDENIPDSTGEFSPPDNETDDSDDAGEFVEEVEELGGAEESPAPQSKSSEDSDEIADLEVVDDEEATIDALPDIDNLSDSFDHTESMEDGWEEADSSQDSNMTVDVGGVEEDPRIIAKAVQTMLKKE